MECPNCHSVNRESAKFCSTCGTELLRVCSNCQTRMPLQARFCDACGTPLQKSREDSGNKALKADAEHRQLTVMFCDLVGSTQLSQQFDPEELREIIQLYQTACAKIIRQYDGYIAQYLGDGLLVYFGFPSAHEDDARRAVRSGLGILGSLEYVNERLRKDKDVSLSVRIAVHTGMVVVGEIGAGEKREQLALGDTPNIAARLEGLADANTMVISQETYKLIKGYFDCLNLGRKSLKGVNQPIEVYQILHESGARSRLETTAPFDLTPLIGREQEMALMIRQWEQTLESQGRVLFLSGEAGIGKSRLVHALKTHIAQDADAWLTECRCSPYHQSSAFYPITDFLEKEILQTEIEQTAEEKLVKLEGFLTQYGYQLSDTVPLFAGLLSIPYETSYNQLLLNPELQKQRILQILLSILLSISKRQPVLFVVEDLHWVDPSTLQLLQLITEQAPAARILTLFTFRPEFTVPWPIRTHMTHLALNRLSPPQIKRVIERITKSKSLPVEIVDHLISKTDGVPLFVEELTKMVLESGLMEEGEKSYQLTSALSLLAIPSTLKDSLMARLDRLASVKEVAQLGAVIGREFPYALLKAVSPLSEEQLMSDLQKLVEAEMLYQQGILPQATYLFKHALIRDSAYQSLLKSKRRQYHRRVAQALENAFPELTLSQPELVANHYMEAGLMEQSITYWLKAGRLAVKRHASREAITHLRKGLQGIDSLPHKQPRKKQELDFLMLLVPALKSARGYTSKEIVGVLDRAYECCQELEDVASMFTVLQAKFTASLSSSQFGEAKVILDKVLKLAENSESTEQLVEANLAAGFYYLFCGHPKLALEHLDRVIYYYDQSLHSRFIERYDQDPGVLGKCISARVLWVLGFPDQALKRVNEGLVLALELSHPYSIAFAYKLAASIHTLRREGQAVLDHAERSIAVSKEHNFQWSLIFAWIWRGWALAELGRPKEGIIELLNFRTEIKLQENTPQGLPHALALLAEAYLRDNQLENARATLTEALHRVDTSGEYWYAAELYRLQGEVLLANGESPERSFLKALDVARSQQAKSWELRSATSLARFYCRQGAKEKARKGLEPLIQWFTEGQETVDLHNARAVLQEISITSP